MKKQKSLKIAQIGLTDTPGEWMKNGLMSRTCHSKSQIPRFLSLSLVFASASFDLSAPSSFCTLTFLLAWLLVFLPPASKHVYLQLAMGLTLAPPPLAGEF